MKGNDYIWDESVLVSIKNVFYSEADTMEDRKKAWLQFAGSNDAKAVIYARKVAPG